MEFFLGLAVIIVFFLVGRELVCWYLKINKRVDIAEKIEKGLRAQREILREIAKSLQK